MNEFQGLRVPKTVLNHCCQYGLDQMWLQVGGSPYEGHCVGVERRANHWGRYVPSPSMAATESAVCRRSSA
jgi:hypothetical protein